MCVDEPDSPSSRSICLNLREAWAKRRYAGHFLSKLTDCDGENSETDSSLDFALQCNYISAQDHQALAAMSASIGRMLGAMIQNYESFCEPKPSYRRTDHRPTD